MFNVKAQILQLRYQNFQEGSNFNEERQTIRNFQLIVMFSVVKNIFFSIFQSVNLIHFFTYYILEILITISIIMLSEILSFQNKLNHNFSFGI